MSKRRDNNGVPSIVFWPDKISRRISTFLVILIDVLAVLYGLTNRVLFDANTLMSLSEFSMSVILAIIALGISVLQSDNSLIGGNSNENKRKVFVRYVFSIFPTILIVILGYMVSIVFSTLNLIICGYSIIMILMMTRAITSIMASFVSFLNIKD